MKKTIIAINVFALILFCSCKTYGQKQIKGQRVQEITIPIDMSTHRPIVDVMINGNGPYKFIFDTGSTTNVIDQSLQEEFGFQVLSEDQLRTPGSTSRLTSKRVAVPKVNFPGTNITRDLEMNTIALKAMLPVDGIIGGFFFEEYLLTIDYPNSKLILTIGELNKTDKDVISFIQDDRSINLNIDVAGNKAEAHLDSGNPYTISLPYTLKDKLSFKETPKKGSPMRTPAATFESWDAVLEGNVTIGNAVFENPNVRLIEGLKYVNLGYAVINELRISIDRKNNLIKLERINNVYSSTKMEKVTQQKGSQTSIFAGNYEGDRKIWINTSGKLVYKRDPAPMALELVQIKEDLYEIKIPEGVFSPQETPKVLFIKNEKKEVTAIELVYNDRKDGPFKKISD